MGKVIMSSPVTLDGFVEGPQRELDWVIADDELHDFYVELLQHADLLLYGRVTYELMVSYWPNAASDPAIPAAMKRFADTLNPMRKILFSKTLQQAGWNTQVKHEVIPDEIEKLKAETKGEILLSGGPTLAQAFISLRLVDEFQLVVQPVAIGRGKSLFGGTRNMPGLDLKWSRPFASGAVALCYQPRWNQ